MTRRSLRRLLLGGEIAAREVRLVTATTGLRLRASLQRGLAVAGTWSERWLVRRLAYTGLWTERMLRGGLAEATACSVRARRLGLARPARQLILALSIGTCVAALGLPIVARPWVMPWYEYAHDRARGQNVFDSHGRWLGVLPGSIDRQGDFSTSHYPSLDHKAVEPNHVPDLWWKVLVALEDRHLGSWRSLWSIDPIAFARAAILDWPRGHFTGASTLSMQLVRSMHHEMVGEREPWSSKLRRKALELTHAPVVYAALGAEGLRDWCATHLPLIIGEPGIGIGGSVYGLDSASRLAFGTPPHRMTDAQQALLAAAVHRPLILATESGPSGVAASRFERLRTRARAGLERALDGEPERLRNALEELAEMSTPRLRIERRLASALDFEPQRAYQYLGNPVRRATVLVGPQLPTIVAELEFALGARWRSSAQTITLNFDVFDNLRFRDRVRDGLTRLQWHHTSNLRLSLCPACNRELPPADVLVVLADDTGRVRRHYAQSFSDLLGGPVVHTSFGTTGALQGRPVASLGKALLVLLLARRGATLDDLLCNARIDSGRIRNPDGGTGHENCASPGARVRTDHAMARSLNLPFIRAALAVPRKELLDLALSFGVQLPRDVNPAVSIPLGMGYSTPAEVLGWFQAVGAALEPRGEASNVRPIERPTLVGRVTTTIGNITASTSTGLPDLSKWISTAESRTFAKEVLSAPVRPAGTLERLSDWTARSGGHFAKSGTSTLAPGVTRDLWAVGTISIAGRRWTYLVLLGTSHPARPIGTNVSARAMAPLLRITLAEITQEVP